MGDVLTRIMNERRAAVDMQRQQVPESILRDQAARRQHHSLADCLRGHIGTRIIAEMKQASPSAGLLRACYDPAALAADYTEAGACALSILTEPLHFMGDQSHVEAARAVSALPILRKDFICDSYQIAEAAAWGADVILLIVAALDDAALRALYETARGLGLEVLVEAHTAEELERATMLEDAILGVNSRNLRTLKTDLDTARRLASLIPSDRLAIAESGIRHRAEIVELESLGYSGFLIGEALVRDTDAAGRLRVLLGDAEDDADAC